MKCGGTCRDPSGVEAEDLVGCLPQVQKAELTRKQELLRGQFSAPVLQRKAV